MTQKKKYHHNYQQPKIDVKTRMSLEAKFRQENENARVAGMQYGILAMGLIALMATIACSTPAEIRAYMIDASEILAVKKHMPLEDIITLVNTKMKSNVTKDQIVEVDPSYGQFF